MVAGRQLAVVARANETGRGGDGCWADVGGRHTLRSQQSEEANTDPPGRVNGPSAGAARWGPALGRRLSRSGRCPRSRSGGVSVDDGRHPLRGLTTGPRIEQTQAGPTRAVDDESETRRSPRRPLRRADGPRLCPQPAAAQSGGRSLDGGVLEPGEEDPPVRVPQRPRLANKTAIGGEQVRRGDLQGRPIVGRKPDRPFRRRRRFQNEAGFLQRGRQIVRPRGRRQCLEVRVARHRRGTAKIDPPVPARTPATRRSMALDHRCLASVRPRPGLDDERLGERPHRHGRGGWRSGVGHRPDGPRRRGGYARRDGQKQTGRHCREH